MTSLQIPGFVTALLSKEVTSSVEEVLKRVSVDYNIPFVDLYNRYLSTDVEIITSKLVNMTIKKTVSKLSNIPLKERCMSRVWAGGKGDQCKRRRVALSEYCTDHLRQNNIGNLRHGRIDQPIPTAIFSLNKNREKIY
jgi:hypothetical protein